MTNKWMQIDVRLRLAFFLLWIVLVFLFNHPLYNVLLFAILLFIIGISELPLRGFWGMVKTMLPVFIIILLFTLFTKPYGLSEEYSEKILFDIIPGKVSASLGGLIIGINFLLRILMMMGTTYLFIQSTPIDDIFLLLNQWKAPYAVSILLTTAITFVPTMNHKKDQILQAQRARGATSNEGGIFGQLRSFIPIMIPLITNSILMADNLAIAMTNRGYGANDTMTMMKEMSFKKSDGVVLVAMIIFTLVLIYIRFFMKGGVL